MVFHYEAKSKETRTGSDIIESTGRGVQQRVQESKRALASRNKLIVQERNDTGKGR